MRRGTRLVQETEDVVKLEAKDGVGYHKDKSGGDVQDSILGVTDRRCQGEDSNREWSRRGMKSS